MFKLISKWWRRRQRSIDMQILWPACKSQAPDLESAKAAFAVHAFNDPAWTQDYSEQELYDAIDALN